MEKKIFELLIAKESPLWEIKQKLLCDVKTGRDRIEKSYHETARQLAAYLAKELERIAKTDKIEQIWLECYHDDWKKLQDENKALKAQLETAIIPRYKVGKRLYYHSQGEVKSFVVKDIRIAYGDFPIKHLPNKFSWLLEEKLFATEAAAKSALEQMNKGEQK